MNGVGVGAGVLVEVGSGVCVRVAVLEGMGVADGFCASCNKGVGIEEELGLAQPANDTRTKIRNTELEKKIRVIFTDPCMDYNSSQYVAYHFELLCLVVRGPLTISFLQSSWRK